MNIRFFMIVLSFLLPMVTVNLYGAVKNDYQKKYNITWFPNEEESWNIIPIIERLHNTIPIKVLKELKSASPRKLRRGMAITYEQYVQEFADKLPKQMSVELSAQLIDIPYQQFSKIFTADSWGVNLENLLGGEKIVYERDDAGRVTRQLERMVLTPMSCIQDDTFLNMDMTKVEVISYVPDSATVNWRVMYSDNGSTESDVGSVTFKSYQKGTMVIFHSAHKLRFSNTGFGIPSIIVKSILRSFFLEHINNYKKALFSDKRWLKTARQRPVHYLET